MNKFVFVGNVMESAQKESKAGKKFVILTVTDGETQVSVSLFGQNVYAATEARKGTKVKLTGRLASRYYDKTDKHYLDLRLDDRGLQVVKEEIPTPTKDQESDFELPF